MTRAQALRRIAIFAASCANDPTLYENEAFLSIAATAAEALGMAHSPLVGYKWENHIKSSDSTNNIIDESYDEVSESETDHKDSLQRVE